MLKVIAVLSLCWMFCQGYKPVILMHGIFPSSHQWDEMTKFIQDAHPGTNVTTINLFNTMMQSFKPMWQQTLTIQKFVSRVMSEHPEGVNLLCFSQGGLICRALLQTMPDHNCHTFIALSSPLAGQYGDTDYLRYFFPMLLKSELYRVFYKKCVQNEFSVANYWNDPHHQDLYKNYSAFLAVINNQKDNLNSKEYRRNFLRIKRMVAIGGPQDGVITPWQSSHFGFYDEHENVVPYNEQEWYLNDSFGLRTLVERNDFHTYTVPGVQHVHWHVNKTVFDKYIVPWLS